MSQTEDADDCELQLKNESNGNLIKNEDEQLIEGLVISGMVSGTPEQLADPAILAVRENPKFRYSRDELLDLREAPLSKKKPEFINTDVVPQTIWDPEHWNDRKKSTTPTDLNQQQRPDQQQQQQQSDNRRRPGDPRERIRKENDGIVLSPQRRSFNSGCFVPMREQPQPRGGAGAGGGPRAHSPIGGGGGGVSKNENAHINVREIQATGNNNRRIGSGRILRDSWDFNEKNEGGENDYYRGGQEDRRSFRRDYDMSRDNNKDRRNNGGRYGRRISGGEKDEEPEWFSGGPLSQHDTIELRGFDEPEKVSNNNNNNKKKVTSSQAKRVREWAKKKTDTFDDKLDEEEEPREGAAHKQAVTNQGNARGGAGTPTPRDGGSGKGAPSVRIDKDQQQNDNDKENRQGFINNIPSSGGSGGMEMTNDHAFLFDDIFKCDTIPGLLTNGVEGTADKNTTSRFSRWFKQESPPGKSSSAPNAPSDSRRSSLHEEHLLKNLLNDLNEPAAVSIVPPPQPLQLGNADSYFAPISPAAVNSGAGGGEPGLPRAGQLNIADMFRGGKRGEQQHHGSFAGNKQQMGDSLNSMKNQFPGKVMSLNELESRMRKGADISGNLAQQQQQQPPKIQNKREDEMSAFKRLLAQVSGGHVVTANNGASHQKMPPMSLMEMLSHSQQQEEVQARLNHQSHLAGGGPSSPKPHQMGGAMQNDFLLKMQQAAQQEQQAQQLQRQQQVNMLNKLMGLHTAAHHLRASPLQDLAQQQSKELLSRPEAQAILQGLKRGDITPQHLYQQLANPALQPRHREMLFAILKMQKTIGPSPRVLSPVPPPPHHHMFPQQQQQQQLRVSPLPNAMHQRIPSPRELQVHTQNILQRALIKKKLEEQQENFRKKQEMQQPGHSPNNIGSTNKSSVSSPTPLAFTPTSVLRKMTADKEDGSKDSKNLDANKFPQGRAVIGARIPPQQQESNQWNNQYRAKIGGRPIVKANSTYQNQGPEQFFNAHQQQQQQQQFMFNQQQQSRQQQQQGGGQQSSSGNVQKPIGTSGGQYGGQQKQLQQNTGAPPMGSIGQYSNQTSQPQQQQFPQLTQQQLRAQHQQQSRPVATAAVGNQPNNNSQQKAQNFPGQQNTAWQQFLSAAAQQTNRTQTAQSGRSVAPASNDGGDLSPTTSDQLARWFSSDLLERARGGELPSTAGLAQHAVSLEEIERQTAPPVRN